MVDEMSKDDQTIYNHYGQHLLDITQQFMQIS
jgi:hypothetical protein